MKEKRKILLLFICLSLLLTGCASNNKTNNENNIDNNENSSSMEETIKIEPSKKGHTLNSSIGEFIVDRDGSVYYENYEEFNYMGTTYKLTPNELSILGTKQEYTNYTHQNDPFCDLEKGCTINAYKLNITNVKSAYEVMYGNSGTSGRIIFLTYDGKVHSLNFNLAGDNKISLSKNISKCSNIVSVVKNMSFGGHGAMLIDANGDKCDALETNNNKVLKKGHTLNSSLGNFIIDKDGSVYYGNYDTINYMGEEIKLTANELSILGEKKEYKNYTYQTDSQCDLEKGCTLEAYKLNLTNIQSAYEIVYGNGTLTGGIIFLTYDGKVNSLYYDLSNNQKFTLKQDISKYPNIVSVVENVDFGGHNAKLIDKNGNMYDVSIY